MNLPPELIVKMYATVMSQSTFWAREANKLAQRHTEALLARKPTKALYTELQGLQAIVANCIEVQEQITNWDRESPSATYVN